MTRAEGWERFLKEHQQQREALREEVMQQISQKLEQLIERIFEAFEEIRKKADQQKKEDCVHFLFGLQRCDLLSNKARVRLDVMNPAWYMDEDKLTVQLDLTFLFESYFAWKERLLLDMRSYMGKVNQYDVENLIQEEIISGNRLIAHPLRFAFRNLEEQKCFRQIKKLPYWIIRWGEYKDYSEIVMRVNREERGEAAWLEAIERYSEDKEVLTAEYWYKVDILTGDCQKKQMFFTTFEECNIRHMDFSKAEMRGVRFIRCSLDNCKFTKANLQQADFEDCEFMDSDFTGANMSQATFSKKNFPWEFFEESQLKEMFLIKDTAAEQYHGG